MQLKGWEWTKADGGKWNEVDPDERGPRPDIRGDGEGEVYDTDTRNWYRDVEEYRRYTSRLQNPPFNKGAEQEPFDLMGMAMGAPRIAPSPGGTGKLDSFFGAGIQPPGRLGADVAMSADEGGRMEQISVNRLGPFPEARDPERIAEYASKNPANGAIPVVLENGEDRIGDSEMPDPATLASRAHNSALAIIDPSGLDQAAHQQIKMTGNGELSLNTGIPSRNFVCVLMPVQLRALVSGEQIARFNIRFVGSQRDRVQYNFKRREGGSGSMMTEIDVPAYQAALTEIFAANPDSIFLTHIIRLSPKMAIPTVDSGASGSGGPSTEASGGAEASSSSVLPASVGAAPVEEAEEAPPVVAPAVVEAPAPEDLADPAEVAAPAEAVAAAAPAQDEAPTPEQLANAVHMAVEQGGVYAMNREEAGIDSVATLIERFGNLGIDAGNADAVFAVLDDELMWMM